MPSFANPAVLLLLPIVPAVLWWWSRSRRSGLRYSSAGFLAGLSNLRCRQARFWGLGLRGVGLVFLVLALAGPRWPDLSSRVPTEGMALAVLVDVSASMNERDFIWEGQVLSRLEAVKKVLRRFVAGDADEAEKGLEPRNGDLVGVVIFATHPDTLCPLTQDHGSLLKLLDAEEARTVAGEATTNPGDAIAWALAFLQKAPTRQRAVLLFTDGESNVPAPALTPRQAAQLAGNLAIPIYAIEVGRDGTAREDTSIAQTGHSLDEIARLSGGRHFQAWERSELAQAVAAIDRLEREKIEGFQYQRYIEAFSWLALASLFAWCSIVGLEATYWRKLP